MASPHLEPDVVFAKDYRVLRPLDEGGMGAVYVVEQLSTGELRALKVMQPHLVTDPRTRERFLQEARVRARIKSEHAVKVIAAGVDELTSTPWLAMELLDGETLDAMVTRRRWLPAADVCTIFEHLGHALSAAHAAGIVHRDIKPENIFVATSQRADVPFTVKLLDFGIAKVVQGSIAGATTGNLIGSPLWMAPEQCNAGRIRAATDVWSLGLLAFWALTGEYYWKSAHNEDMIIEHLLTEILFSVLEPPSVRAASFGFTEPLPPGFDEWFARSVERNVDARYQGAAEAVNALLMVLSGGKSRVTFPSITPDPGSGPTSSVIDPSLLSTPPGLADAPTMVDVADRLPTTPLRRASMTIDRNPRTVKVVGVVAALLVLAAAASVVFGVRGTLPSQPGGVSVPPRRVVPPPAPVVVAPVVVVPVVDAAAVVAAPDAAPVVHEAPAPHPAYVSQRAPRTAGHTFQRRLDWDTNCNGRQHRAWGVSPYFASHFESETAARVAGCVDIVGGIGWCCP